MVLAAAVSCGSSEDETKPNGANGGSGASAGSVGGTAPAAGNSSGGASGASGARGGASGSGASGGSAGKGANGGAGGSGANGGSRSGAGAGGTPAVGGTGAPGGAGEGGADGGEGGARGGEGGAAGGGDGRQAFAYVSRLLGGLVALSLDASGEPVALAGSPVNTAAHLYTVASHPTKRFLYTGDPDSKHLDVFPIAANGTLPLNPSASITLGGGPVTLAIEPSGHFAYAGTLGDHSVHVFAIDQDTGALTEGTAFVLPELNGDTAYVAAHPLGRFVYVTQQFGGGIHGYEIAPATGALSELDDSPFVIADVRSGALVFRPDAAFLYSAGSGLNAFAVDSVTGNLDKVGGSPFTLDLGSDAYAQCIAMDPLGKFLYTTSFLPGQRVRGFSIRPTSGALDEVPGSPLSITVPYSVAVEPSGRFLLVGRDSGDLSVLAINRSSGALRELDDSPFPRGGLQPEFAFALAP